MTASPARRLAPADDRAIDTLGRSVRAWDESGLRSIAAIKPPREARSASMLERAWRAVEPWIVVGGALACFGGLVKWEASAPRTSNRLAQETDLAATDAKSERTSATSATPSTPSALDAQTTAGSPSDAHGGAAQPPNAPAAVPGHAPAAKAPRPSQRPISSPNQPWWRKAARVSPAELQELTLRDQDPPRGVIGPATARRAANLRKYDLHIREAASLYDLPSDFIRAVIAIESNCNPRIVSPSGAIGLMQLMPRTAKAFGVEDAYDPRENVLGGTRLLRFLSDAFDGDPQLTLAAYNAGAGSVRKYGGVPPFPQTQQYVKRVLSLYDRFRAENNARPTLAER